MSGREEECPGIDAVQPLSSMQRLKSIVGGSIGNLVEYYDWYVYTPPYPNNNTIYWRIDNVTAGTSLEGTATQNLPDGATAMRMSVSIRNLDATSQSISYQRIYVESDR